MNSSASTSNLLLNDCKCIIEQLLQKSLGSNSFFMKQNIINKGRPTPKLQNLNNDVIEDYSKKPRRIYLSFK